MHLFAYLIPGLPQLLRGEWFRGLVFFGSAVALVGFLFWSNREFLGLYGELRHVAPRSAAQELWTAKTARRDVSAVYFGLLFAASLLDGVLGRRGRPRADCPAADASTADTPGTADLKADAPGTGDLKADAPGTVSAKADASGSTNSKADAPSQSATDSDSPDPPETP